MVIRKGPFRVGVCCTFSSVWVAEQGVCSSPATLLSREQNYLCSAALEQLAPDKPLHACPFQNLSRFSRLCLSKFSVLHSYGCMVSHTEWRLDARLCVSARLESAKKQFSFLQTGYGFWTHFQRSFLRLFSNT